MNTRSINSICSSHKAIKSLQKIWTISIRFTISLWIFKASKSQLCSGQWRDRELSDFIKKILICVLKMNAVLWVC